MHTMAVKKLRFWFCDLFVFKRQTSYVKGYHLSIEGILNGYVVDLPKLLYKRVRSWTYEWSLPVQNFVEDPLIVFV